MTPAEEDLLIDEVHGLCSEPAARRSPEPSEPVDDEPPRRRRQAVPRQQENRRR